MSRRSKVLLVLALVGVVAMAFRVSWNALRDVARAIGADSVAATLYPFVVDGLMALALVATLVLTGTDRRFALRVLAGYTVASLVLNYVHGLLPALHGGGRVRLADWSPANWGLVLLATSLPVGSIFFGSDLVGRIVQHGAGTAADTAHDIGYGRRPDVRTVSVDHAPDAPQTGGDGGGHVAAPQAAVPAAQPATAPADTGPPTSPAVPAAEPGPAPRPPARQVPGAARNARAVRADAELLTHLNALRTGADGPLSQRAVLSALGIGAPRLKALMRDHDLSFDPLPLPAPRPLHAVTDDAHADGVSAAAL